MAVLELLSNLFLMDYISVQCYCSEIGRTILIIIKFTITQVSTQGINLCKKLDKKLAFHLQAKV